jgi:ATP-dependent protease ClpP protease subunit
MPRNRSLVLTATADNGRAQVRIEGDISSWENNASAFRSQVEALVAAGVRDAHVYMNTRGGNVMEANEIVNIIKRFPGRMTGEGGALVASAGTNIMLHLEDFGMPTNGMVMIHKPSGMADGNEDQVNSFLVALKKLTQQYRALYAKAMGKTDAEVEALWAKGDVWLTAQEAKDMGLIKRITDAVPVTEEDVQDIAACGAPTDKLPTASAEAPLTHQTMDIKALRATLGMPETATEADVLARVSELNKAKADREVADKAARAAEVKTLIDAAVKDRKITEEHRASFEAKFAASFDATKAELEALKAVPQMAAVATGAPAAAASGRDAWSYDEWATKDLKGLQSLMVSDPDKFSTLYEGKYGVKPALPAKA